MWPLCTGPSSRDASRQARPVHRDKPRAFSRRSKRLCFPVSDFVFSKRLYFHRTTETETPAPSLTETPAPSLRNRNTGTLTFNRNRNTGTLTPEPKPKHRHPHRHPHSTVTLFARFRG